MDQSSRPESPVDFYFALQETKQSLDTEFENNTNLRHHVHQLVRALKCRADNAAAARQRMAAAIAAENILPDLSKLSMACLSKAGQQQLTKGEFQLLLCTLHLCHTCTDASPEFSAHLVGSGDALQLLKSLLAAWVQPHLEKRLEQQSVRGLKSCLSTVYNALWQGEAREVCSVLALKQIGIVEAANQLFQLSDNKYIVQFSFLILVYSCSDDEAARFLQPGDSGQQQERVGRQLRQLVAGLGRVCAAKHWRTEDGFSMDELLACVRRFSRRPDHRPLLLRQDCLAELQRLLQTAAERPASQIVAAFEIALSLSLHPTCVDAVRRSLGSELQSLVVEGGGRLADAVRCLLESPESDLKEQPRWTTDAFSGPNEELRTSQRKARSKNERKANSQASGQKPSVLPLENGAASAYLVLSWSRQDSDAALARWLVAKLNENWHRTIDLSTDSTAGLIDGCRAVILCVSKPYELNSLCEFEAHRAEVLEKPLVPLLCGEGYQPGSWLSPILARYSAQADLLIDFSKQRDRAKSFSTLIGRLNGQLVATWTKTAAPAVSAAAVGDFSGWSSAEVGRWLSGHQLPAQRLGYLNGRHLEFLVELKREAPEAFYRMLREDLRLDNFELVFRFTTAVKSLG
ncbi:hypothetical protein BOX15_Mlig026716g1 [Macrostomum lignano]|uniref:TIR domain-containing protein n=1 Tax=Macrostomum lignano TaxID=282301 RepID=A0A267H7S8_9PLAT|nr:hypothetical protein BOX15_Mlig026716g1 [Macrostomum lignano]